MPALLSTAAIGVQESAQVRRGIADSVPAPLERRAAALAAGAVKPASPHVRRGNHDTIGMCVLDAAGNLVVGGSTNGANHKIAGRVSGEAVAAVGLCMQ